MTPVRAVAGFALAALVAGCGSGGAYTAARQAQSRGPASPSRAAPQLRVLAGFSMASVRRKIEQLYREHPQVARYSAQDVTYSRRSRAEVLRSCAGHGTLATEQEEVARVLACAPLVYFYYRYGRATGISEATGVADAIYSYASTQIRGPSDARTLLDGVLRGWGLPVAAGSSVSGAGGSPAATELVTAIRHAIGTRQSVRVTITGYRGARPREQIVSDTARDSSTEILRAGLAYAEIRVIHGTAYVRGNQHGLRSLIGLPTSVASAAASRWLRPAQGSAAAKNLAAENSLSALPSSILPGDDDRVLVSANHEGATTVKVLRWSAAAANGTTIHAVLTVRSGPNPLPISETTSAAGNREVVRFTRWDAPLTVTAPAVAIPLAAADAQ